MADDAPGKASLESIEAQRRAIAQKWLDDGQIPDVSNAEVFSTFEWLLMKRALVSGDHVAAMLAVIAGRLGDIFNVLDEGIQGSVDVIARSAETMAKPRGFR